MFLLIRRSGARQIHPVDPIYIPLCFYLYRKNMNGPIHMKKFTFHYVSTYTQILLFSRIIVYFIYIPLCFYLYVLPIVTFLNPAFGLNHAIPCNITCSRLSNHRSLDDIRCQFNEVHFHCGSFTLFYIQFLHRN